MKYNLIIIRYGEIGLKAKETRNRFENILINNIKKALDLKKIKNKVKRERGRIFIHTDEIDKCALILQKIFGITSFSPAIKTTSEIDTMSELSKSISKKFITKQKSFALRVTRTGTHEYTSQDVAIKIGNDILNLTGGRVDLNKPDFKLFIEIRNNNAYIFTQKIRGPGGMPIGTQGNVLALISSPKSILAAWYIMRRGCKIFFVNHNNEHTKMLNSFIKNWNAFSDVFTINRKGKIFYPEIQRIAYENNCDAIVTGNNILNNNTEFLEIKILKKHINLPILYPLIAMEKNEIIQECKNKGISL